MTDLAELTGPPVDRYNRYKLPKRDDLTKHVSYTRATTVAASPNDMHGLMEWSKKQVAIGMGRRPDLVQLAASANPDDKNKFRQIVEEAEEAGGSTTKRNTGTAVHAAIEEHNRGNTPPLLFSSEVEQYCAALAEAGLTPVPELVERIVVNHEHMIAGTPDIGLKDVDGNLYVGDLKTGSVEYPAAMAIQLAIYATAHNLVSTNFAEYEPIPEWSQTRGVIIHLPPDGECQLHWIDLQAGHRGLQIALDVRQWRSEAKKKTLLEDVEPRTLVSVEHGSVETSTADVAGLDEHSAASASLALFEQRYEAICAAGALDTVKGSWPDNIPGPKRKAEWSEEQTVAVLKVIQRVFDDLGLPFDVDPTEPPHEPRAKFAVTAQQPALRTVEHESELIDSEAVATLRTAAQNAPTEQRKIVSRWMREADAAKTPFQMGEPPVSKRCWTICRTALKLAYHDTTTDDEIVRGWLTLIIGEQDAQHHTVGALLGTLSTHEAEQLADLTLNETFAQAIAEIDNQKGKK